MADRRSGQDRGPSLLVIQIVMMVSATTAVLLRFVARRMGPGELWWDDWTILAALIPTLGGNITNIVAINYGLGRHVWEAPNNGLGFVKTVIPVEMLFTLGVGLAKGSVLLLYRRIFHLDRRVFQWVHIVAGIVIAWCIAILLVIVLQCRPMATFWNPSIIQKGHCLDFRALNLATAIGHTITTLIVVSLPQPLIWKLNMNWGKKIAYSGMCFLGILTAIASIGRIVAVNLLPEPEVLPLDFTWYATPAIIWYSIEPAIGIICACLPCIGPIFRNSKICSNTTTTSAEPPLSSSSSAGHSLDRIRRNSDDNNDDHDDDDLSRILRHLGASCEISIYAAAAADLQQVRRKGGGGGGGESKEGRIHVRRSTLVD